MSKTQRKLVFLASGLLHICGTSSAYSEENNSVYEEEGAEIRFGRVYSDPYRWMENSYDGRLIQWVDQQNERLDAHIKGPEYQQYLEDLRVVFGVDSPMQVELQANSSQREQRRGNSKLEQQLIESQQIMEQNQYRSRFPVLSEQQPPRHNGLRSPKQFPMASLRTPLYQVNFSQETGTDHQLMRFIDLEASTDEKILYHPDFLITRFAFVVYWETDDTFLYVNDNFGRPTDKHAAIYRHRIGTRQSDDEVIYSTNRSSVFLSASINVGGRLLISESDAAADEIRWGFFDIESGEYIPWITRAGRPFYPFWQELDGFYAIDYKDDPFGEIVFLNFEDGQRRVVVSQELLGQRTIDSTPYLTSEDKIVITVIEEDGTHGLVIVDPTQGEAIEAQLPQRGRVFAQVNDVLETCTSTTGWRSYALNTTNGEVEALEDSSPNSLGIELVNEVVYYTAHNGQKTPILVTHAKDTPLAPNTPMVVYGYGGFEISSVLFSCLPQTVLPWYARGGAYAVVTLPGGLEFGYDWRDASRYGNRKNVYRDFAAATEKLISLGYTSPSRTVASGGSNGGLLVAETVNLRPDLFAVSVPEVGVLDLLRYEVYTAGEGWLNEYGSSFKRSEFDSLLKYSPYHSIPSGRLARKLPATLVITSDKDDRVVPSHSFKFAARLMEKSRSGKPVFLMTEEWGGHGGSADFFEFLNNTASKWAFIIKQLDM